MSNIIKTFAKLLRINQTPMIDIVCVLHVFTLLTTLWGVKVAYLGQYSYNDAV